MIKLLLPLLIALSLCSIAGWAQTTVVDSFRIDGRYRSYRLYIPAGLTQGKEPLVLNMHGLASNATEQQYYSDLMPVADSAGFYMVMPQGTYYNGNAFWNVGTPGTPPVDDVRFLSALIDTLTSKYPVDKARVYATGMSNGGYMSHLLGMKLNNKIAAIASVTGSIAPQQYGVTVPGRAVPAMQIHGTADATVAYYGSAVAMPIDSVMKFWVRNNGCHPVPVQTPVPNRNTADGCTATRFVWSGGTGGATVELFMVTGGGHTWPGSPYTIGVTNQDFSAAAEIWRFFRQYRLEQFSAVERLTNAANGLAVFPSPANGTLHISAPVKGTSFIVDLSGRALLSSTGEDIDISTLPAGVYLLQYRAGAQSANVRFVKE